MDDYHLRFSGYDQEYLDWIKVNVPELYERMARTAEAEYMYDLQKAEQAIAECKAKSLASMAYHKPIAAGRSLSYWLCVATIVAIALTSIFNLGSNSEHIAYCDNRSCEIAD